MLRIDIFQISMARKLIGGERERFTRMGRRVRKQVLCTFEEFLNDFGLFVTFCMILKLLETF